MKRAFSVIARATTQSSVNKIIQLACYVALAMTEVHFVQCNCQDLAKKTNLTFHTA